MSPSSSIRLGALIAALCLSSGFASADPIRLHPQNPHYFEWRGRAAVLVTSGEHYGSLMNLDFDFRQYLAALRKDGLNNTRVFSGAYCENPTAFNIQSNTLAPLPGRLIAPWARSGSPGYANGGNKFDLDRWDEGYFKRAKEFLREADRKGVVVEFTLFCPFYKDSMWALSPMNVSNNVNGLGGVLRSNVYTLDKSGGLLAVQEAMVRKVVTELNASDNLMWEICNEPYFGGVAIEWQHRLADVITETERALPKKHLITQNIANGRKWIENPHPEVSVFNFHYATPPDTVAMNYELNKVMGDNETGFKGQGNAHYRKEGWEFLLAGGALYNNLDYSFAPGHEDGSFRYHAKQPGGGNAELRRQIGILRKFVSGFDFVHMHPQPSVVAGGMPKKGRVQALVQPGRQYAIYISGDDGEPVTLKLDLPSGRYRVEWINVLTGRVARSATLRHGGGEASLTSPAYTEDIALSIRR